MSIIKFPSATFVDIVRQRALQQPEKRIYTFLADGETQAIDLTYAEVDQHARIVAASLLAEAKFGDRVLLLYPPGLDYIAAFLGCLYAGMVAVPAYAPNPAQLGRQNRSLTKRLFTIIKDAQPRVALTTPTLLTRVNELIQDLPLLKTLQWRSTDDFTGANANNWKDPGLKPDTLAFLQYTSGSTSTPRGVMLTHENLMHNSAWIQNLFGHTEESSGVIWLPPYHDMGLIGGILQPLYANFPVTLMSPVAFLQRPIRWLEAISHYQATASGGPNFAYDLCVRKITPEQKASLDLRSWKVAFTGAEPIRSETLTSFVDAFGACGFRKETFVPCYGLAEATLLVSSNRLGVSPRIQTFVSDAITHNDALTTDEGTTELTSTYVGCGEIPPGEDVRIVDPQTLSICPAGHIGEIWIAGPNVAQGYWQREEETRATFRGQISGEPGTYYLRTGDLGFLYEGELFITGRLKDLIIIRGRNHYPQDIELTVERSHPGLRENATAAFVIEDREYGAGRLIIVQELERRYREEDLANLAQKIRQAVAEEHEIQVQTVVLIKTGTIPKTSSGKIQRGACKELFLAGKLEVAYCDSLVPSAQDQTFSAMSEPQDLIALPLDKGQQTIIDQLSDLVARSLHLDPTDLDISQPLSSLGLDSLMVIELQLQIEAHWGIQLPVSSFWDGLTLEKLASSIITTLQQQRGDGHRSSLQRNARENTALPEVADAVPLSYGQRALWFLYKLAPASSAYNIAVSLRIRSTVDVSALRRAFSRLLERHTMLQSIVDEVQGKPLLRMKGSQAFDFHQTDVADWDDTHLKQTLRIEAQQPFDLVHGPLLRVSLFRKQPEEHILLLVAHHILLDFWSLVILARDLGGLYTAEVTGQEFAFSTPASDYANFVRWQQQMLEGPRGDALKVYWRKQLAGELSPLNLPTDQPRPAVQTYRGSTFSFDIDEHLTHQLKKLAQKHETTLYTVLQAALQVLLHRYSGQNDILIGSPVAGRSQSTFAASVGYISNTVVLRGHLQSEQDFSTFLLRTKQCVIEALEHQDYPFARLVEDLQPERDTARSPLFQVMFVLQKAHQFTGDLELLALEQEGHAFELGELTIEAFPLHQEVAQFDLTLMMAEAEGKMFASWLYNSDLFVNTTIERLSTHFLVLLQGIVDNPTQTIGRLPILGPDDLEIVLRKWNKTTVPETDQHLSFISLIEAQVARTPEAPALIFGDTSISYAEFNCRTNQLARYLQSLGVGQKEETLVGIYLARSLDMAIAVLAVLKAGGTLVALDPTHPQERLILLQEDAKFKVLLTQEEMVSTYPSSTQDMQVLCLNEIKSLTEQLSGENIKHALCADNLAYIIYTSGSTGRPKGLMMPHRTLDNLITWQIAHGNLQPGERTLQFTSLTFDISFQEMFTTLGSGGTVVMISEELRRDSISLLKLIEASHVQRMYMPSTILQHLAEVAEGQNLFPKQLKAVTVAGEQLKITEELIEFFHKLQNPTFENHYGPSEAHVVAHFPLSGEPECWPTLPPVGRPIANTEIYLLDALLQPVPRGIAGEMYVGGQGLSRGYLQLPAQTAEKFIPHPFSAVPGARLYKTGDLGRYTSDGNIEFLGRVDQQVKIRGVRIELSEVEIALNKHADVTESVVSVHEYERGGKYLVAYIVSITDPLPTVNQLRSFLQTALPEAMIPSAFVFLESLPLDDNGKLNRRALPKPQRSRPNLTPMYISPRTLLERQIADIWQSVLKLERVGIHDNFFDLGGHSLLMVEVQSKLSRLMEREIPIVDLFRYTTISMLVGYLDAPHQQTTAEAAPARVNRYQTTPDIAIIGLAGRFPTCRTSEEFWQNLCDGQEFITHFTDEELRAAGVPDHYLKNPNYVKAGAILENADSFDASFFGFSAREAEMLDPQQRNFLECSWEALENAGYDPLRYRGNIGVFAGSAMNTYLFFNLQSNPDLIERVGQYQTMLGNDKDFLATRVSYKMNLQGPSLTVQTACSTSLVAVHLACQSLLNEECDMALAGGVAIRFPQKAGYLYQEGGILSPDGHCRTFSDQAKGTVPGSGVGAVILKRLDRAIADHDHIYAVIKGSAINNDGSQKAGYTAPSIEGQSKAIASALVAASIDPTTISYIEAHGTGTPLGDPIEIASLAEAYGKYARDRQSCAIGSVKTNMGHADAAAGIGGLLKVALALHHRLIPPSLHYTFANPQINFAQTPFYVNTDLIRWEETDAPLRAAVNSLGIGGTNAHVIVEQAPVVADTSPAQPWQILPLSAKTSTALQTMIANLRAYLAREQEKVNLADVAYTLQVGRSAFAKRCVVLCQDRVTDALDVLESQQAGRFFLSNAESGEKSVIFMFPGQGTQDIQMASELYQALDRFRAELDHCADLLHAHLGLDIRTILYPADSTEEQIQAAKYQLEQTALTQPILFSIEYSLAKLLRSWNIEPQAMIGHSLGEYTAACLAGVFSLEDALRLTVIRGKLIQALPGGRMLSVVSTQENVRALMQRYPELSIAAINSPTLFTLSGPAQALTELEESLVKEGIECRRVCTSHAFHSSMMDEILEVFYEEVKKISLRSPGIPYISNVTGTWITSAQATDPHYWVQHLRQTVQFADGIQELQKLPEGLFLEIGPGRTLSTLVKQCTQAKTDNPLLCFSTLPHSQGHTSELAAFLTVIGKLWLTGISMNWEEFWRGSQRRRLPLPSYPFEGQSYFIAPNQQQAAPEQPSRRREKDPIFNRWFYMPSWRQSPFLRPAMVGDWLALRHQQPWLIFSNECSLAKTVITRLQQEGQEVFTIKIGEKFEYLGEGVYTVNPIIPENYLALFKELRRFSSEPPQRILHFWTLTEHCTKSNFAEVQNISYYSLLFLVQALEKAGLLSEFTTQQPLRIEVVGNDLFSLTDVEPLCAEKVTILGPCKVIPQEYPFIQCRCLDVVLPQPGSHRENKLSEQILIETVSDAPDPVIAYRGSQRWVQFFEPIVLSNENSTVDRLRENGVYLITGGLGSVGFIIAEYLVKQYNARLVLLGRTKLPPREEWDELLAVPDTDNMLRQSIDKLLHLEKLGGEILFIHADVADQAQMEDALRQVDKHFGVLHGVIHSAGVTRGASIYRPLNEINKDLSEEQFRAKAYGLYVLEEILKNRRLDFCLLFGSTAAILGGLGFTAYSAANLFTSAFACRHNQESSFPWLSIDWDVWDHTTTGKGIERNTLLSTSIERYSMTTDEGIQAFEKALTLETLSELIVSPGNLDDRLDLWTRQRPRVTPAEEKQQTSAYSRPPLPYPYVEPRNEVEQSIANIWELLLGVAPIGIHDDFFDLGGHSLLATQLMTHIQEAFHVQLSLQSLFETPTVAQLALLVLQQLAEQIDEEALQYIEQLTLDEIEEV